MRAGFALAENNATCTGLASTVLDIHLQDMVMEHFVEEAWQRYFSSMHDQTCAEDESKETAGSMGVVQTGGLFVGLILGALVSIAISYTPSASCTAGGLTKTSSKQSQEPESSDDSSASGRSDDESERGGTIEEGGSTRRVVKQTLHRKRSSGSSVSAQPVHNFDHLPPDIAVELLRVSESLQILSRTAASTPWDETDSGRSTLLHVQKKVVSAGTPASVPDSARPWGGGKPKKRHVSRGMNDSVSLPSTPSAQARQAASRPTIEIDKPPHWSAHGRGIPILDHPQAIESRAQQAQLARPIECSSPPGLTVDQLQHDYHTRELALEAAARAVQNGTAIGGEVKTLLSNISHEIAEARLSDRAPPESARDWTGETRRVPDGPRATFRGH